MHTAASAAAAAAAGVLFLCGAMAICGYTTVNIHLLGIIVATARTAKRWQASTPAADTVNKAL